MPDPSEGFTEGDDNVTISIVGHGKYAGGGDDYIIVEDESYTRFVHGEEGDDTIIGGVGRNFLSGGDGYDHLIGNDANDRLAGDYDGDLIEGHGGDDALYGGDSVNGRSASGRFSQDYDLIDGTESYNTSGDDTLYGGDGDDELLAYDGDDELYGGNDDDRIFGGADDDTLFGGDGVDELSGGLGDDILVGGDGVDTLSGGVGDDTLFGDRFDLFFGTSSFRPFDGGRGYDILTFEMGTIGLTLNMEDFRDIEHFVGTRGNDVITPHHMSVDAHDGDDRIRASEAGQNINGGAGFDIVTYQLSTSGVFVALDAPALGWATNGRRGDAEGDQISYVEGLIGSDRNDRLYGDGGANSLVGRQGDDFLQGGEGADTLNGNMDDDTLIGGAGADELDGGAGNDTASYRDSKLGVYVHLSSPTQGGHGLLGDAAFDKLISIENLIGSYHADHLLGDDRDNRIEGSFGADTLEGFAGNDTLIGAQGDDTMTGGKGEDVFIFNADYHTGNDTITDFEEGIDRIEIYGEAEAEIIIEDWGAMVVIQGPEQLTLTIKDAWEIDLTFMG